MARKLRKVLTAGGIVTERVPDATGESVLHVWLVARRESVRAHAANPAMPLQYQLPKGHVKRGRLERSRAAARREVLEELGIEAVAYVLLDTFQRLASVYENGVPVRQVQKVVLMYAMTPVAEQVRRVDNDEYAVLVPAAGEGLRDTLAQMHHPEEAESLARCLHRLGQAAIDAGGGSPKNSY